jgi:hypothetical protein
VAAAREPAGRDEERDAPQSHREPEQHDAVRPLPAVQPVEHRHPDGDGRDDERGDSGRHALLRPRDQAVASEQHQRADDRGGDPLAPLRRGGAAQSQPSVQQQAGRQVARARQQERRNRLDADADPEVRRAPEHVDGREREHELGA